MNPIQTIAIDGPAASGKSTVALRLADHLGFLFFDTGVMYRAITWAAQQRQVAIEDEMQVTDLAEKAQIDVCPPSQNDGRTSDVLVDGRDVTWEIREPQVDAYVSVVSAYPGVRRALVLQQRRVGQRGQVVMVGRDIGTVVLPNADLKIFLDASTEQRAKRRYQEIVERDQDASFDEIILSMRQRDQIDTNREVAPLRPADDAVILHSDYLDADQVLNILIQWVQEGNANEPPLPGQVSQLTVLTNDLPSMKAFYCDVLGFILKKTASDSVKFEHQGMAITLFDRKVWEEITGNLLQEPGSQSFGLTFAVSDSSQVDQTYIRLLARGASPVKQPSNSPQGQRIAFFADPDGNIHEITAEG